MNKKPNVICIHIGARAHYLIPRALQDAGLLHVLITDTWVKQSWLRKLFTKIPQTALKSLAGRYHEAIPKRKVQSFGFRFLVFELKLRLKHTYSWTSTLLRDQKFEILALQKLNNIPDADLVLGISYTSLLCFEYAKQQGMKTVLFQIDPGFEEEERVAKLLQENRSNTTWERAPKSYWENWRKECALSDRIFVNSNWSKIGLVQQGIDAAKIAIIPLPFSVESKHLLFQRHYPTSFTKERPLRCLFLGTLSLRKGIHIVLEAAKQLQNIPIEFIFVGRNELDVSEFDMTNVHYKGIVTREQTDLEYQQADVFLFPTFSDGFGLTQLEAMAWKLPVISTTCCGEVVEQERNGWIMEHIDAATLYLILQRILAEPTVLESYSTRCLERVQDFSLENFTKRLTEVIEIKN